VTGDGSMNKPFQTIGAAQNFIKINVTKANYNEINVEIRGGMYFLTNRIAFTNEDSGTEQTLIRYRAYNNEQVRLVGGVTLGGWSAVTESAVLNRLKTDAKTNVKVASLGDADPGNLMNRGFSFYGGYAAMELFFKTEPMTLARYPNNDFLLISSVSGSTVHFTEQNSNVANWGQESDPWAFGYWKYDWADDYVKLSSFGSNGNDVSFDVVGDQPGFGIGADQRFYLQNFLSELDSPGEYYIDRDNSKIYFWPTSSDYTDSDFIVSTTDNIFKLNDVSYLTLEGFTIEATRKAGIDGYGLTNVTVRGLTIRNTGTDGAVLQGPKNILVENCVVNNPGDRGFSFSGGERNTLTRSNHMIRNNIVKNFSRWSKTYRPAFNVDGVGATIEHNEMFNGPHTALLWSGNYHTMQYNIIHDVCRETGDVGAFYSGRDWTRRGNVIKHNFFYNINGPGALGASGVYFDDQYSSGDIIGNIFYNVYRAVLIGGGRDNNIHNNMFIDCQTGVAIDARGLGKCGPQNAETLNDNLIAVPYQEEPWLSAFPTLANILENDPHAPIGNNFGFNVFVNMSDTWKAFCPEEDVAPFINVTENCFNLTREDFVDANGLNFNLVTGALNKCSSSFAAVYQSIPFDSIGAVGLDESPENSGPSPSQTVAPSAVSATMKNLVAKTMMLVAGLAAF
jgi:hypothetical protein